MLLVIGVTGGFEDRLDASRMPAAVRAIARVTGTAGYIARALAFIPIGVFFVVAAVTHNAHQAKGLDATVREFSQHWWGTLLLIVIALGFLAFAIYAFIEAVYREVDDA